MRNIIKSKEPDSLTKFKGNIRSNDWGEIHQPENQYVYEDCVLQCMDDQNGLCGYTEIKIEGQGHIDHFIKRSIDPKKTYDWSNMIWALHSHRYGADFKDTIVNSNDYDQTNSKYFHILNPISDDLTGRFSYMTDGSIVPVSSDDEDAEETIRVFNLQEESLKSRRKQTMDAVRVLKENGIEKNEILEYMKGQDFPSVVLYELSME